MMNQWARLLHTPATQLAFGMRKKRGKKKTAKKKSSLKKRRSAVRASKIGKAPKRRAGAKRPKLVKGSRAAKLYMAKIRKKRK